ncbi:MAG: hypothetical protein ACK6BG_10410 [Cyanobacteriota bacterium]
MGQTDWFAGSLIKLLDRLLMIVIAQEVLQIVMASLRDQVVQTALVLLNASLRSSGRGSYCRQAERTRRSEPGFGIIEVGLAAAYWLVRKAGQGANRSLERMERQTD